MDRPLTALNLAMLIGYAISLAGGQVLFKYAAMQSVPSDGWWNRLVGLAVSPAFVAAIALYAGLSVFWVWLLTTIPLSRAYPFVAVAFALTSTAGILIFGEPMSWRLVLGCALIFAGLVVIAQ